MQIAVVADPHYHDIHGWQAAMGGPAFRTLADTIASTRVFNESFAAFPAVLDEIVRDGISIVVIVGDLTDDGQAATVRSVNALLTRYTSRHGVRFFMTPGNHDLYAMHGRHQGKRFLNADGTSTLVTSDAAAAAGSAVAKVVTPEMYCAGYADGLPALGAYGFFRRSADRHWECPFGASDALADRRFTIFSEDGRIAREMIDASYLVEPVDGLWLLSLDANVFEPRNGHADPVAEASYIDSTDAGWNAVLKHKRFVLDWAGGVAARARTLGKRLVAFSHYPMIDPQADMFEDEVALFGNSSFVRRSPRDTVVTAAIESGIGVHFSGHLHVSGAVSRRGKNGFLVNVAVPSLVGYPAAYKRVRFDGGRMVVETVPVAAVPGYAAAFDAYRREGASGAVDASLLDGVADYADYVDAHLQALIEARYLPLEWPADLAGLVRRLSLAEVEALARVPADLDPAAVLAGSGGAPAADADSPTLLDLVVDSYRLRKARGLALRDIPPERLARYLALERAFAGGKWSAESVQGRLAVMLRMLATCAGGPPSEDFAIALDTGEVTALGYFGRTERRQTGSARK